MNWKLFSDTGVYAMAESWFRSLIPYVVLSIYMAIIVFIVIRSYKSRKNEEMYKNKYYPTNKYFGGGNYGNRYSTHSKYKPYDE